MTRTVKALMLILALMMFAIGLDYVTGNQHQLINDWSDETDMPLVWGSACLLFAAAAVYSVVWARNMFAVNTLLFGFAVNVMFAVQVYDPRMSPIPWPPEDVRLITNHLAHAGCMLVLAAALWWREGVKRRCSEIIEQGVANE